MDASTPPNKDISQSDIYGRLLTLRGSADASQDLGFRLMLSKRIERLPEEAKYTSAMLGFLPIPEPSNEKAYLLGISSSLAEHSFVDAERWMRMLKIHYSRELGDKKQEDLKNSEMDLST